MTYFDFFFRKHEAWNFIEANDKIFNSNRYYANNPGNEAELESQFVMIPDINDDEDETNASEVSSIHFGSVGQASQRLPSDDGSIDLFDIPQSYFTPTQNVNTPAENQEAERPAFVSRFEDLKHDKQAWTNFSQVDWSKCK